MPLLRLVIPSPLRNYFDYLPPEHLSEQEIKKLKPGTRISVPFGRRTTCGILVDKVESSDVEPAKLRPAIEILDKEPLINRHLLKLCLWAADYYKHPPGEILKAALPPSLRDGKPQTPIGEKYWRLTLAGEGLPEGAPKRAPKQAEAISIIKNSGGANQEQLRQSAISSAVIRELEKKALVESAYRTAEPRQPATPGALELNEEQAIAFDAINTHSGFACYLLEGITGSGKTEVYLQLIAEVINTGKQALVLVPEIGLTPQTLQRFQRRFEANIAVLHSGLSDRAREKAWEEARSGQAHIVLGTRSAVFTSLANPGLIVVDEEHDISYKQQEGFRYSARDVAVMRGQMEKVPVVLGSATPSLESLANADAGKYRHLKLMKRANQAQVPEFVTIDLRNQALAGGMAAHLQQAIAAELQTGNQVLVFLNRRGYAPTLQCHDCGYVANCSNCDARLTLHRSENLLRCHHCGWQQAIPQRCPECHSQKLMLQGIGTERLEEELARQFPNTDLHRVDRDSMMRKGAMERVYEAVGLGDPCILVGTQMLSKGHHFPKVTLVALVDVDSALFSGDFRAPERLGQLLTQVAGRAGREDLPGKVYLQTNYPEHPLLLTLIRQGYSEYASMLLQERSLTNMPPFAHLLLLRAESGQLKAGERFLAMVRQKFELMGTRTQCIGPLPAAMSKRQGRHRWQLLLRCPNRKVAQSAGTALVEIADGLKEGKRLRWTIDIDPLEMM